MSCGGSGGLYPVGGLVLLVGFGPFDQWTGCSWWVRIIGLTRVPMNQGLSPRSTAPCRGQGSNAVMIRCLTLETSVDRIDPCGPGDPGLAARWLFLTDARVGLQFARTYCR